MDSNAYSKGYALSQHIAQKLFAKKDLTQAKVTEAKQFAQGAMQAVRDELNARKPTLDFTKGA